MPSEPQVEIAPARGIAHTIRRTGLAHFGLTEEHRRVGGTLQALADEGVNLLFLKRTPTGLSFAVELPQMPKCSEVLRQQGLEATVTAPCGVVCVVGSNMRYSAGVMWRILTRLWQANVRVICSSDSFNSVSCLVPEECVDEALRVLGEEFGVAERRERASLDPW